MNALVVESDSWLFKRCSLVLELHAPPIEEIYNAQNGRKASMYIKSYEPEIVIIDFNIPYGGYNLVNIARQRYNPVVIAISNEPIDIDVCYSCKNIDDASGLTKTIFEYVNKIERGDYDYKTPPTVKKISKDDVDKAIINCLMKEGKYNKLNYKGRQILANAVFSNIAMTSDNNVINTVSKATGVGRSSIYYWLNKVNEICNTDKENKLSGVEHYTELVKREIS